MTQDCPFTYSHQIRFTHVLWLVIGVPLMLLRMPVILVLLSVLCIYHTLLSPFIIFQSARRVTDLVVNYLLIRSLLLTMGFITLPPMIQIFRKDYVGYLPMMNSGYIVLSNHCSPVDYLYFQMLASPTVIKYSFTA